MSGISLVRNDLPADGVVYFLLERVAELDRDQVTGKNNDFLISFGGTPTAQ